VEQHSPDAIGAAVDVLGDRWTLLVLRDIVFHDRRYFRALLTGSAEGIASNILSDRLKRLLDAGILTRGAAGRGQRARFSLTDAGIAAVPILLAYQEWGGQWRDVAAPPHSGSIDDLMAELTERHRESDADG
jgi:DNA-binding HxlR family transcriptional regulator